MKLLDTLYSNTIYMTVLLIVVLFACVGAAFLNPFKTKKLNYAYKGFLYLLAFSVMMSLQGFYYGFADEFKSIFVGNKIICLFEEYERGGEGPSENVSRLHIIDKTSGERKTRFYSGSHGELVGLRHDTLCYLNKDDVVLYDAVNLKEIYTIAKDNWGTVLPELAAGMESVSGNQNRDQHVVPLIELNCKNGKRYWFEPFSRKISEKEPENIFVRDFTKRGYEMEVSYAQSKSVRYLDQQYFAGSGKLRRIVPTDYSRKMFHVTDSSAYIEPFFLCIDTLKKVFVFGHYKTTDREDFFVEAKDFDFKTLWKKDPSEIGATDSYNKSKSNVWKYKEGTLYFNCGGFVIAMEPVTGKTIWISRL